MSCLFAQFISNGAMAKMPPHQGKASMSDTAIVLHGTPLSGHTHRVGLMLNALGLAYRFVSAPKDVRASPAFLALNPLGQTPGLQDGSLVLADSNAILVYLARRYAPDADWLPLEPVA